MLRLGSWEKERGFEKLWMAMEDILEVGDKNNSQVGRDGWCLEVTCLPIFDFLSQVQEIGLSTVYLS